MFQRGAAGVASWHLALNRILSDLALTPPAGREPLGRSLPNLSPDGYSAHTDQHEELSRSPDADAGHRPRVRQPYTVSNTSEPARMGSGLERRIRRRGRHARRRKEMAARH